MRKVYAYGYFGWSEVIAVRDAGTFGLAITTKLVGDARPTTHGGTISTNMLAFEPSTGNAFQRCASVEGANESAAALATLVERFPILNDSNVLTQERIVEKLRRSSVA